MSLAVKNNIAKRRFEAQVDDYVAFVEYRLDGKQITFVHTEVPHQLGGQGVAGGIVKAALEFAKNNALKVVPECPFVAHYIEEHQEYCHIVHRGSL